MKKKKRLSSISSDIDTICYILEHSNFEVIKTPKKDYVRLTMSADDYYLMGELIKNIVDTAEYRGKDD